MRTHLHNKRHGQVLVMVTLAMFVLFGMLGMVVDLGWSYFVRKSAQSAADAAALAAVQAAMDLTGGSKSATDYTCGLTVACTSLTPVACPGVGSNLSAACLYAKQNGFETRGRQRVTVVAGDRALAGGDPCGQGGATVYHPPTTGCVDTYYWVTVRVTEQIPQLFSAVFGNSQGGVSARATAVVTKTELPGALFLLGRGEPWNPSGGPVGDDVNLYIGGGSAQGTGGRLIVPPGINLASDGNGPQKDYAGEISGSGMVVAGQTLVREGGGVDTGSGSWTSTPTTGVPDGDAFEDPYADLGQPPLTATPLTPRPVLGGNLACNPCPSGNYFAVNTSGVATGDPIVINSTVTFDGGVFGDFNFFGGLNIGGATATFGPGRYVIAGVNIDPSRQNSQTALLNADNGATILSSFPNGSGAGSIFILTDSTYPGLATQVSAIKAQYPLTGWTGPLDANNNPTLYFSKSSFRAGNSASSSVQLNGLNATDPSLETLGTNSVGSTLADFAAAPIAGQGAGIIFWQDQGNSYVKYTDAGNVDTSCGTLDSPCMNTAPDPHDNWTTPQLELWSSDHVTLNGVIYQPRGAWVVVQANATYTGPLRIVSGAMKFQGSGTLVMTGPTASFTTVKTTLIE